VFRSLKYRQRSFAAGKDVVSFLADAGIFPSKGEARKNYPGVVG